MIIRRYRHEDFALVLGHRPNYKARPPGAYTCTQNKHTLSVCRAHTARAPTGGHPGPHTLQFCTSHACVGFRVSQSHRRTAVSADRLTHMSHLSRCTLLLRSRTASTRLAHKQLAGRSLEGSPRRAHLGLSLPSFPSLSRGSHSHSICWKRKQSCDRRALSPSTVSPPRPSPQTPALASRVLTRALAAGA